MIAAGAAAVYGRTLHVPLFFDDVEAIVNNPSIHHWSTALWPPSNSGTCGRPIANLSLAINYAISGPAVWSYHVANLVIHVLAGLTLFGILRRTLTLRGNSAVSLVGCSVALLWTLHPLQTESVTCIIQRTESLMGLFYLLTLYCFIRGAAADSRFPRRWFAFSIVTCLLGMATKEVMVSAPLMILLYDRTFVAGSFRAAWQRHRRLYFGLACTWILLGVLMMASQKRGGTVGYGLGVSSWDYALTQCRAIVLYLKLSVWPHPLVVDYGTSLVRNALEIWPQALLLILLTGGTMLSLWRWPAFGFVGAWFFAILAPSSSVVPLTTQTIAEHRMYLPLAAVITLAVMGIHRAAKRQSWIVFAALSVVFGFLTLQRNGDYRSEQTIWSDTVAKNPTNSRAHNHLGYFLQLDPRRRNEAIAQFDEALRLKPDFPDAHNNLGNVLLAEPGRQNEAIAQFNEALRLKPDFPEAHNNLGSALLAEPGRLNDAIAQFEEALRLRPDFFEAHFNLGTAFQKTPGRLNEAIAQFEEALRIKPDYPEAHDSLGSALQNVPWRLNEAIAQHKEALRLRPDYPEAHNNLGNALLGQPGRFTEAIAQYEEALRLRPDYPEAHNNLGNALFTEPGRLNEAIAQYEEALRLKPDYPEAHNNLGNALFTKPGRLNEAIAQYEEALRLKPDFFEAHFNLGTALQKAPGRLNEAIAQFEEALRLKPDYPEAHNNLGTALQKTPGRLNEAIAQFEEALRLKPDYPEAHNNLGVVLAQTSHPTDAIKEFRRALQLKPDYINAQRNLETLLQSTKE